MLLSKSEDLDLIEYFQQVDFHDVSIHKKLPYWLQDALGVLNSTDSFRNSSIFLDASNLSTEQ